jgi:hypothetical protein
MPKRRMATPSLIREQPVEGISAGPAGSGRVNFLNQFNVICPVQSPLRKYSSSHSPKSALQTRRLIPHEGRIRIVTYVGMRCGGRGSVGRERNRRADFKSVSEPPARRTNGADAYGKTVWSWHPLLVSSRRRFSQARPGPQNLQSADDGDKTNSSPGRARHKP